MEPQSDPQKNKPLQILDFEIDPTADPSSPRTIRLHKENLKSILDQAGDKRIAVISIAGPSRQGKSFLLGFMIRYLEALEKDESDWMDWDNNKKPLEGGFTWRSGVDHETTGMLMWSKPFIIKSNDTDIAVLLMDTQGTYDEFTTHREMTTIVGLSLLTSSCLIFNFFNSLQEDVLSSLETYIQYGQLALGCAEGDAEGAKPFQKLMFLIRDWNTPSEFPYGGKGGKGFLEKKLQIKPEQPENVKKIRKTLKECFDCLDCFLMPDPGEKAKQKDFNGCLAQLSKLFAKKLEELINELLNPDELPNKSVFGSNVIASDMVGYFEKYVEVFNGDELPEPSTLMEATAQIANKALVMKLTRKYVENMKKKLRGKQFLTGNVLMSAHKSLMENAMKEFNGTRKLGNEEMIKLFEEELRLEIKREFGTIDSENTKKKEKLVEAAVQESKKSFHDAMRDEIGEDKDAFLEANKLKIKSRNHKSTELDNFEEHIKELDENLVETAKTLLETQLDDEEAKFLTENDNRRMMAEKKMREQVEKSLELFLSTVKDYLEENQFLDEEEVDQFLKESQEEVVTSYKKAKKLGSKDFLKNFETLFLESLDKEAQERKNAYRLKIQEAEASATTIFDATICEYETNFKEILEGMSDLSLAGEELDKVEKNAEDDILKKLPVLPESSLGKKLWNKLKPQIHTKLENVTKEVVQAKKNCEDSYKLAAEEGFVVYIQDMEGFLKSEEFHDQIAIQDKHDEFRVKAMQTFNASSKVGTHPDPNSFLENLEAKMQQFIAKSLESNVEKRDKAFSEAKNRHHEALRDYQSEMLKKMDIAKDEEHMNNYHNEIMKAAVDTFKNQCKIKESNLLDPLVSQLEDEINESFKDEINPVFELKLQERESGTTTAIADARKFYREEMAKHYNNTEFMRPKDLEELHKKMSKLAIDKCTETTPLSQIQKEELESALLLTYEAYEEENNMNVPVDPAIGIDLGTTYSCVGVYLKGKVKIIPNLQGKNTTPSYVCYNDQGFADCVGIPAKEKAYENAEQTVFDAKRILGRSFNDPVLQNDMKLWAFQVVDDKQVPKIQLGRKTFFPEQISSEVLKEMRVVAEKFLNCEVKNAVITVPAYFSDGQREATMDAGKLAGLNVLNILTEPVSAAVAYKLQHTDDDTRHVLVFDLGGGTFDVAILRLSKGIIDTLAVDGDTHLGGEDFDQNVMKFCAMTFKSQHGIDLLEGKDSTDHSIRDAVRRRLKRLQLKCEQRKIELASCQSVDVDVDGIYNEGGTSLDLKVTLTRDKFEELNEELFEKTIDIVKKCLQDSGLDKSKIDDIVLVGGSTRIPKVQELLSDYFEGRALNKTINPDEAVAYGAAVQAAIMNGQIAKESIDFNKIQDVSPMSLGVEVYGGGFSIIIPKNTKIPVKFKEQYRTAHNNQTSVQITVYQGESDVAVNNTFLGDFYLNGVPPADAGRETIDVFMEINLQGVLHVTAVCTSTGEQGAITVTENKRRMGKETIKRILAEAKPGAA